MCGILEREWTAAYHMGKLKGEKPFARHSRLTTSPSINLHLQGDPVPCQNQRKGNQHIFKYTKQQTIYKHKIKVNLHILCENDDSIQ